MICRGSARWAMGSHQLRVVNDPFFPKRGTGKVLFSRLSQGRSAKQLGSPSPGGKDLWKLKAFGEIEVPGVHVDVSQYIRVPAKRTYKTFKNHLDKPWNIMKIIQAYHSFSPCWAAFSWKRRPSLAPSKANNPELFKTQVGMAQPMAKFSKRLQTGSVTLSKFLFFCTFLGM